MFNHEFICQNIFKQESSKIDNTYFFPSKNQARLSTFFFIPSKNQARQQLQEKAQSRSRQEFWQQKARDQEFQASLALLCFFGKIVWTSVIFLLNLNPLEKFICIVQTILNLTLSSPSSMTKKIEWFLSF